MKRSIVVLIVLNLFVSASGFLREMVTAYFFGTTAAADAFSIVIFYVDAVATVFQYGLASYMLVPLVTGMVRDEGFRLVESISLWLLVVSIPIVAAGLLYPDWLGNLVAPNFSVVQKRYLAALIAPGLIAIQLVMVSNMVSGFLRAYADYYTAVNARAIFNLIITATLICIASYFGIKAAGFGLVFGSILQLILVGFAIRRIGWIVRLPRFTNNFLRKAFTIGVPSTLAIINTNVILGGAQRFIASGLPEGALASANYAQRTLSLISGITLSLMTVSLTELSTHFHDEDGIGVKGRQALTESFRIGIFFLIPLSVLLFSLSEPVVALLFNRGRYDAHSLIMTAKCLRWFVLGVFPGMVVGQLQGSVCPAFQRTRHVLVITSVQMFVTIAVTYVGIRHLQIVAIPVGFLAGLLAATIVSIIAVIDLVGFSFFKGMARYSANILAISCVCFCGVWLLNVFPTGNSPWTTWSALTAIVKQGCAFVAFFSVGTFILGDPHIRTLIQYSRHWRALAWGSKITGLSK